MAKKKKSDLKEVYNFIKKITIWKILKLLLILIGVYVVFSKVTNIEIGTVSCVSNSMPSLSCTCPIIYTRDIGIEKEGDIYIYKSGYDSVIHRFIGYCNYTDGNGEIHYTSYKMQGDSVFNSNYEECIPPYNLKGKILFSLC